MLIIIEAAGVIVVAWWALIALASFVAWLGDI